MLEGLLQPMHLLVILIVGLFVFGPKKLPELGKGLAEGIRGFKTALNAPNEGNRLGPTGTPPACVFNTPRRRIRRVYLGAVRWRWAQS